MRDKMNLSEENTLELSDYEKVGNFMVRHRSRMDYIKDAKINILELGEHVSDIAKTIQINNLSF